MSEADLLARMVRIKNNIGKDGMTQVFDSQNFKITNKLFSIEEIESYVRENDFDIVVIDYLQLIRVKGRSEYERTTEVSRRIAELAKKTKTCIVALSQVSEEFKKVGKMETMGFKGSG